MADRRWRDRISRLGLAGAVVAVASVLGNLLGYLVLLLGARRLDADAFGALASVMAISAIAGVPALGLQTAVAMHLARFGGVHRLGRLVLITVAAAAGLLILSTPLLAHLLHLPWASLLLAAVITAPVIASSAWLGRLQGEMRFRRVAAGMLLLATARCGGVIVGLMFGLGLIGCLVLGAVVSVVASGLIGLLMPRTATRIIPSSVVGAGRDLIAASSATLVMFVLSYADLIAARRLLPAAEAADYAVLTVLSKGAIWAPQMITIMALPYLAKRVKGARGAAMLGVAAIGAVLVAAAALAGPLALRLAGGPAYTHLSGYAWAFAVTGALYALVFVLTNAEVASGVRAPAAPLWAAVIGFAVVVSLLPHPGITSIVVAAMCTAVGSTAAILAGGWWRVWAVRKQAISAAEPA
ncbi:O-antigen/teichoic acid export membrane protein [Allocatelliglobosispora scoriae]|uniref:O-antigen/teichoic acid export membrane protein n=1 Tax=Allocatelliglobosispora scoriae TaxID=643052 RepID=A0A841BR13_9ACTN|nr:polysaccharide biosynthesis protein [Allocatelliglobosispora scoriae]MBB5869828.1 O-antigen/teichoic acid export membrane protein [Allocatelliglobosispora scoriae]